MDGTHHVSDGLFARWWPILYPHTLPQHPEPAEDTPERVPGLLDEAN
ncbi:hypothetical protein [Nonomuraea sp. NPDC002799]